jgi:hypothetical protein
MPMHYTIQVRTKENNWLGWPEKHHSLQKARQAERVAKRGASYLASCAWKAMARGKWSTRRAERLLEALRRR